MMLIEDVARIKELEDAAEPGWSKGDRGSIYCAKSPNRYPLMMPYGINANAPEIELVVELRNAAPALLDVLGAFREGDVAILSEMLVGHIEFEEEFPGENPGWTDLLSRLTNAACKMEAKQE